MAERSNITLSIVVPVYNEAPIIEVLVDRLAAAAESITDAYEIVFVNDGSKDETLYKLKTAAALNNRIHYISFSRNFGHQVAIMAGMDYTSGGAIVTMDGDLQDPPELIPRLYEEYVNGNKVVYAKRTIRNGETFLKLITAKLFYRLMAKLVSFDIPIDVGDFRLISRDVLEYLKQMKEHDKYLRGQIAWLGFKSTYVLFERDERLHGKTKYSFGKLMRLAINGITSFSDSPLRLATSLGFIVCFISFIIIIYALFSYFYEQSTVPGWASLIISITFLGGVQLLSLGILGEYISRIINNVRNRPLYVIDQTDLAKTPIQTDENNNMHL